MIQVKLSKNDFEYDIRSLLTAFYPNEIIDFEQQLSDTEECGIDKKKKESDKKNERKQYNIMIDVIYNTDHISIVFKEDGKTEICRTVKAVYDDRKIYKNILKRLFYQLLSDVTQTTLQWGTLTGIRPTKIPMGKLLLGENEQSIRDYMREEYLCSDEKINLSLDITKREFEILNSIDYKNGYSIYIGIPFCPTTCLYCSFTSYSIEKYVDDVEDYLNALYKEIDFASTCFLDKKLTTIYLGGGTPTTLSENQLERLLLKIKSTLPMQHVKEFTVEAGRPDSITKDKLQILKDQGVTRISINPQTMNQKTLDLIGRKHTTNQIETAFYMAREIEHNNINMDIILGLPGENSEDVSYTLEKINEMNPDSLTVHTLAIKRAASLNINREKYHDIVPKDTKDMLFLSMEYAKTSGYSPYYLYRQKNMVDNLENIGYSRIGKEGIYNILIMEEKHTILALGAGASSKIVSQDESKIDRIENVKNVKDYIERIDEMILRKKNFLLMKETKG